MALRQGHRRGLSALLRCGGGGAAAAAPADAAGGSLRAPLAAWVPRAADGEADGVRGWPAARWRLPAACVGLRGTAGVSSCRGFAADAGAGDGRDSSSSDSEGSSGGSGSGYSSSSESGEDDATDADDDEVALPQATPDDPLAVAYRLSKMPDSGFGLPPLEEIMSHDPDAEARAQRRASERSKQEQIAAARVRTVDAQGRAYGTGKRKEAIARVWVVPGVGVVAVNGRPLDVYFPEITWRAHVLAPFMATGTLAAFDVRASVRGGGPSGQAQALRHGVAKALQAWEPDMRPALRAAGLLTRDSRVVERKKPGKAKARKSFQWVKR